MEPNLQNAYDIFLHSGKVTDYLHYAAIKPPDAPPPTGASSATGEDSAYYDRRDRSAGARG